MADVLSQSEVESLLAALDPSVQALSPVPTTVAQDELHAQISTCDFKRPERVSKELVRTFHALHERFGCEFGAGLSAMLRSLVEVKLINIDQLTYSEFVCSLENPTCFNLLKSEGLNGHIILDLNPSLVFPIVDRLMGGGREPMHNVPNRPLTEIEIRLALRITELAIKALGKAWSNICTLELVVSQVESNPQLIQIVPPNEVVVLSSFEITMGEVCGIMNLCVPFNTIGPLAGKLSSDTCSADARQAMNLEAGMSQENIEMTVNLAQTTLKTRDVTNLAIGDVIVTERAKNQGLEVVIEGRPMFLAHPGVLKGHKAIRIGKTITRPQDLVEEKLRSQRIDDGGNSDNQD